MTNKNDSRILDLKKMIQVKKEELGRSQRFAPITNCSLELDGTHSNLNVLDKGKLTLLLVKLNSYQLSAEDLDVSLEISGYDLSDWIEDVQGRIRYISHKDEEKQLRVMEGKLEELLSNDKRVELELDGIESLLK